MNPLKVKIEPVGVIPSIAGRMVNALRAAGTAGMPAGDFAYAAGGDITQRSFAAQWLRQMGTPILAQRKGSKSMWFLAPVNSDLYHEWTARVIADAYVETCRAHMALKPNNHPFECGVLQSSAVALGTSLGLSLSEIEADLTPQAIPERFRELLVGEGYIPSE